MLNIFPLVWLEIKFKGWIEFSFYVCKILYFHGLVLVHGVSIFKLVEVVIKMPQLDLITFVDQTLYVYLFLVINYFLVAVFIVPKIYQILALKSLVVKTLNWEQKFWLFIVSSSAVWFNVLDSRLINWFFKN